MIGIFVFVFSNFLGMVDTPVVVLADHILEDSEKEKLSLKFFQFRFNLSVS